MKRLPLPAGSWLLLAVLLATALVYAPGLSGGWLFDDYPNIVDNNSVQLQQVSISSLSGAALSSPASVFKRPLASLSFAANYLADGLDPFGWKLANLLIHLLNGVLLFVFTRQLLRLLPDSPDQPSAGTLAALVTGAWLLLPINLTGVLYVVQRMTSMANVFVLLGLVGYLAGRRRMLAGRPGLVWCWASLVGGVLVGMTAKETAVMLPLYALLLEWLVFGFRRSVAPDAQPRHDRRLIALYLLVLVLPLLAGLAWQLPQLLDPTSWATRDFTLTSRLLSEARIVPAYIAWCLLPLPHWLSFYHDDVIVSQGLLQPPTTLAGLLLIAGLLGLAFCLRRRHPRWTLGIGLFFAAHLLTGTILPLELVYEHRNYFASYGLLLAVVPWLAGSGAWPLPRRTALVILGAWWIGLTAITAWQWADPLRLATELAARAPDSPRAQYEYGRALIVQSHYDPASPYSAEVYAPLERAAALPGSSILPQQALIFFNARLGRPIKPAWWDSLTKKLAARPPGVQDLSSLRALADCAIDSDCPLDHTRMVAAFEAALAHPRPSARVLAIYSDYAWNELGQHRKALRMIGKAVALAPNEPAYHVTAGRMAAELGKVAILQRQIKALQRLDYGGRLQADITELQGRLDAITTAPTEQEKPR